MHWILVMNIRETVTYYNKKQQQRKGIDDNGHSSNFEFNRNWVKKHTDGQSLCHGSCLEKATTTTCFVVNWKAKKYWLKPKRTFN